MELKKYKNSLENLTAIQAQDSAFELNNIYGNKIDNYPVEIIGMTKDSNIAYLTRTNHILVTGGGHQLAGFNAEEFHYFLEEEYEGLVQDLKNISTKNVHLKKILIETVSKRKNLLNLLEKLRSF
jgi:hypothetical protein